MRKTVTGAAALVAAAALLTGCGSGTTDKDTSSGKAATSTSASPTAETAGATHQVTLEVTGKDTTQVMYHAKTDGFGQQKLPWTKTESVELTPAEQKVGYLVTIVPGSIQAADGTLQQAPCVIKIDGKQVADNDGGKNPKGCSYKIR